MRLKVNLLLIFLCLTCWGTAQFVDLNESRYLDSVEAIIKQPQKKTTDSIKAMANLRLSDYWSAKDTMKAIAYLQSAKRLMHNNRFLNAVYPYFQGGILFERNVDSTQKLYMRAVSLLSRIKSPDSYYFRAQAWNNYCVLEQMKDHKERYLDLMLNKAIPMAEASGRNDELGLLYVNIALAFSNTNNYAKADTYFSLGLQSVRKGPYYLNSISAYCYLRSSRNKLFMGQAKIAKSMLDTVYGIIAPYPKSDNFLEYYEYLGMYYRMEKEHDASIEALNKGLVLSKELNAVYNTYSIRFQQYKTYTDQGNYRHARSVLDAIMHSPVVSRAGNRVLCYYEMAKTYERLGDYRMAYDWMQRYSSLQDSLHREDVQGKINALEIKFRTSEKEKKILALQGENSQRELDQQKAKYTSRLLLVICVFLGLLILLAIFYYRHQNKLKEKNHKGQLRELEQKRQIQITEAMLEGEERERVRMARDLHDGLGGMLAGVKLNLSGWVNDTRERSEDPGLLKTMHQLDNAVSELRRIARNMIPETLLKFGLNQALKDLVAFYDSPQTQINFQHFGIKNDLSVSMQLNIYRMIQELLSNAIKHGEATQIVLQCSQNEKNFLITVEDNGRGFDTGQLQNVKGIGLHNLKSRVDFLKGRIEIISSPGEGTTVNIEIEIYETT